MLTRPESAYRGKLCVCVCVTSHFYLGSFYIRTVHVLYSTVVLGTYMFWHVSTFPLKSINSTTLIAVRRTRAAGVSVLQIALQSRALEFPRREFPALKSVEFQLEFPAQKLQGGSFGWRRFENRPYFFCVVQRSAEPWPNGTPDSWCGHSVGYQQTGVKWKGLAKSTIGEIVSVSRWGCFSLDLTGD